MEKIKKHYRLIIQTITLFAYNFYLKGILVGQIFKGFTKGLCVPGLNCYSCPAAGFSCPLGALQQSYMRIKRGINTYSIGLLLLFSTLFGRVICGYACPFGFFQELLYKIPTIKLKPNFKYLKYLKYLILVVFVIGIPIIISIEGQSAGYPAFCKYICPQGTISGGLLMISNKSLRMMFGNTFFLKLFILIIIIASAIFIFRPFCRIICPLGAIYGLFNSIAIVRINVDNSKCVGCNACKNACPVMLDPTKECNSTECVRCGKCISSCHTGAIGFKKH